MGQPVARRFQVLLDGLQKTGKSIAHALFLSEVEM
jgi:hypothetical protein